MPCGIIVHMTKALKEIVELVKEWPPEVQEEAAHALHAIDNAYRGLYVLTAEDKIALEKSAEDVRLRRFVSEKKLRKFFKTGRA